jgi:ABC-type transport system substrate-binding protein
LAKSASDERSPETLHGVVSMMTVTELSLKGHFCPSCTPNRAKPLFGRKNRMVQPDSLNVGSKSQCTSTAVPELDQMIERALAATDVKEVEKLVGEMHRFLYHNAHNITIGEIHTNYAPNKKVTAWNLGRNLYDNNLRYVIRP